MSDVVVVCVRDDIERAEQLAEMFDDFGLSVSCDVTDEALARCGAVVVVWTEAAAKSPLINAAVARVMASGKGVVLSFASATAPAGAAPSYDLSGWSGDPEDPALDPMFFAVDRKVVAARAMRPVLAQLEERAQAKTTRLAPPVPVIERAAPKPRVRTMLASFAVLGVMIAGVFALQRAPEARAPAAVVALPAAPDEAPRMRLTEASARQAAAYDLTAQPVQDASAGRRGFEPPSAASVGRPERGPSLARAWHSPAPAPQRQVARAPAAFSENASSPEEEAKLRHKPSGHV